MKIMATSDLHGNLEGLDPRGADVVVLWGFDFSPNVHFLGDEGTEGVARQICRAAGGVRPLALGGLCVCCGGDKTPHVRVKEP